MKLDKHYTFIKNNNDYMKIKKKQPFPIAFDIINIQKLFSWSENQSCLLEIIEGYSITIIHISGKNFFG